MMSTHFFDELCDLKGNAPKSFEPGVQVLHIDDHRIKETAFNPGMIISVIDGVAHVLWVVQPTLRYDTVAKNSVKYQVRRSLKQLIGCPTNIHQAKNVVENTLRAMQANRLIDRYVVEIEDPNTPSARIRATCTPVSLMSSFVIELKLQ